MTYQIINHPLATIFRAYDIRGVVETELTPDMVYTIGLAMGSEAYDRGEHTMLVGRDGRLSGPELINALIAGLCASGCNVVDVGMLPTPILYFATHYLKIPNGIMLTGSHNPPNYNGLKMVLAGHVFAGEEIQKLYQRIVAQNFKHGTGQLTQQTIIDDYVNYIVSDIKLARPLNIVIDCGNGVPGMIAPRLFKALGCKVTELFCDVDGNFPNHHPDPSDPKNLIDLIKAVADQQADVGLAFDGDGDRLGVITSDGEMIFPDRQLILFAKDVLSRNPGAEVIYDVKCSRYVAEQVEQFGGTATMWQTGHSFIKAKLKETGAPIAGEMSGHIFFKERWFGFDDGLYAGARLLEILANDPRNSADVFADIPQGITTPEIGIAMADDKKFIFIEKLVAQAQFIGGKKITIDGLRVEYPDGWGLVRCSNTTPKIVLRFEADDHAALERIKSHFKNQMLKLDNKLLLDF